MRTTDGRDKEERACEVVRGGDNDGIEQRRFLSVLAGGGRREVTL